MKQLLTITLLLSILSCKSQFKYDKSGLEVANVHDMTTHIATDEYQRKLIGYDSIQLLVDSGRITANFCYPNTVYTSDTTYRLWGLKIPVLPGVFLVTGNGKHMTSIRGANFGWYDSVGKPGWYLPTVIIDSFKITMTKVKP
jgi:hypothetical protein